MRKSGKPDLRATKRSPPCTHEQVKGDCFASLAMTPCASFKLARTLGMKIDGACHCGYITIEGEADPEKTTICHCTDCQTGTGSAFRVSVPVAGETFRMSGEPASYLKTTADSGNPRVQAF